jgi:SnoaL-like domain
MSKENVELIRRNIEAYLGPNPASALDDFAPDAELDATDRPDGKVWHGRDGVAQAMREWSGTWENWQVEIEQIIDLGDDRVLLLWREEGEGKSSGVKIGHEGGTLFTIRDALIVKAVIHLGRDRALEAAGLSE